METPMHDEEESDSLNTSHLSDVELDDLVTTKFVEEFKNLKIADDSLEVVRDVGSPLNQALSPIERRNSDEFLLEDHPSLVRPIKDIFQRDEAMLLKNRILDASDEILKTNFMWNMFERSKKWRNTSHSSEVSLLDSLFQMVDRRPVLLHISCSRLTENDISCMIRKSLLDVAAQPRQKTVFRVTIKTEMPLKQFLGQLAMLLSTSPTIKFECAPVTALMKNLDGSMRKFYTAEVENFAEAELGLLSMSHLSPMNASARFKFTMNEKPFVTVNVGYHSNIDQCRRQKTIVIEQTVDGTVPARRVTFGFPLVSRVEEYELDEGLPFIPLRNSTKVFDLSQHFGNVQALPKVLDLKNIVFK
ncbi:F-box domain-containing protein [Caenorhabditis elegans]|uniref:F-box domain-containing protein n=1 Tax=Caenorhabditis elegans TaxID=6239 RepID=Q21889_CAEEL|nr:F-box domain-containing protein [Caenorhabditis elegans]CAA94357.2 F-box domain-containing protein [Caenorhabditis elegans]|eukprot:NP_501977.2 Uncharacterized protein CELE_R102.3 [Caenorhabditis elegans]